MIITTKRGRRKSVLTDKEIQLRAGGIISSLTEEEKALFFGLAAEEDESNVQEAEEYMLEHRYHTQPVTMEQFLEDPYYLGESCETLYPELRKDLIDLFDFPYREVLLTGGIGVGKCVGPDTELYDPVRGIRGTVFGLMNMRGGNSCASFDKEEGVTVSRDCVIEPSGFKKLGDMVLGSGKSLRVTPDHPVLTPFGWKKIEDLRPGDLVATSREMPHPVNTLNVSDDEVKWVAYMLGDGCCTTSSMTFTNENNSVHEEYEEVTEKLGAKDSPKKGVRFRRYDGKAKTVGPRGMAWIREKYGLRCGAKEKRVPSSYYGLDDRQLGIFLNRLWACDGWVCKRSGKNWEAGIALASEKFIFDIQQLLLRFSIHSRIRKRDVSYTHKGEERSSVAWSLQILGRDGVLKFIESVGRIKGKEDRCDEDVSDMKDMVGNSNVDTTPIDKELLYKIRREVGPIRRDQYWPGLAGKSRLGNKTFKRISDLYDMPEWCSWWGDVFWDSLESYEVKDEFEAVYDLEVPGTRNFSAHGIIVHNTFSVSIAICRILYELSCLISPQKTFGLSSGTEIVIPLISKNLILARDVMKSAVDDKIKESPYFMKEFAPKISKENTLFPNNIKLIIGSYISERVIGTNVIVAACDECFGTETLLSVKMDGECGRVSIGDLLKMDDDERSGVEILCLDHYSCEMKYGNFAIKKSTVQKTVKICTGRGCFEPSLKHPILMADGQWLVYKNAEDITVGDVVAMENVDDECFVLPGRTDEGQDHISVGVRPERINIWDLPGELLLDEVVHVSHVGCNQTYSVDTEYDTFLANGFVVHNTNFPPTRKGQQITTGFGKKRTAAHFDIVEKVYRSLVRRVKSRFQNAGGDFPGMVIMASSAASLESFTERKMKESANDSHVFVRDHTAWTAKPDTEFCGEKFWVLCSKSSMIARVLEEDEYEQITDEYLDEHEAWVIDIPIEYKSDFETDIENAMRDIAGISTQAISAFIQRVDAVDERVNDRMEHPFSVYEWVAGGMGTFKWDVLCRTFERKLPGGFTEEGFAPKLNPKALRWCHIDTSLSGDASGFAVAHIDRWVEVVRRGDGGERHMELAPYYIVDVILKVNPPSGEQIYLPDLRTLVYSMMDHGFSFIGFSTDAYMYAEMHQQVERRGIDCRLISMDRSVDPYSELKSAIYEGRIEYHGYTPFIEEIKALEYDRVAGKIDHTTTGSKDVSDAVAGAIYGLLKSSASLPTSVKSDNRSLREHSDAWVSGLIPAENVDASEMRGLKEDGNEVELMPILFGED